MKENQIESCPKMFAGKKIRMTKKALRVDLILKNARRSVLKIDACAAPKHKIILSWPYHGNTHFLKLLFDYSTVKFEPLSKRQPHLSDVNHCVFIFDPKVPGAS